MGCTRYRRETHYALPNVTLPDAWTMESLEMMHEYYQEDFERFGYE